MTEPADKPSAGSAANHLETTPNHGALSLADGIRHPMHPGWLTCERTAGWIVNAIVLPAALVGAVLIALMPMPAWGKALPLLAWASLAAVMIWSVVVYDRRAYGAMSWAAHPDRLEVRRGVWWRRVVTIPRTRVQHTDVIQGPLQRRCGIATLVIHTAGTEFAKVDVPGLSRETAEALRDWLIEPNHSSGVDDGV